MADWPPIINLPASASQVLGYKHVPPCLVVRALSDSAARCKAVVNEVIHQITLIPIFHFSFGELFPSLINSYAYTSKINS
jgi:hypothetical protein